jgi:hypothetical protein
VWAAGGGLAIAETQRFVIENGCAVHGLLDVLSSSRKGAT